MSTEWKITTRYIVGVALGIFSLYILYLSRKVITLLVIAVMIAFLVRPLINLLHQRLKVPRRISVLLTYLVVSAILLLAPLVIVPPVVDAVNYLVALDYQALIDSVLQWLETSLGGLKESDLQFLGFSIQLDNTIDPILDALQTASPELALKPPSISVIVSSIGSAFAVSYGVAVGVVGSVFSGIVAFVFMILAAIYFSLDAQRFYQSFLFFIPEAQREEVDQIVYRLRDIWDAFFRGQLTLMVMIGLIVWIGGMVIGLPGAFALGVLAGILEIVPNLGPFLSAIPAVIVALLQGSSVLNVSNLVFALIVVGFYVLVQMFENYLVVPKVLGEAVELHPLVVISGVIVGATVWGLLGALLAAPLIASAREILIYLYVKTLGEEPHYLIEKSTEGEGLSFRESVKGLMDRGGRLVRRQAKSDLDHSEGEPHPDNEVRGEQPTGDEIS